MKTLTYLRWSLLIPILVWGLTILVFMAAGRLSMDSIMEGEFSTIVDAILLFLMFYMFGIIVWIFPYGLLALILFFWSFIAQAQTALRVYALSPIAMMVMTLAAITIFSLGSSGNSTWFDGPGIIDQDFININLLGAGFALGWGYICVGIGYGIYRLLQQRGIIRDEQIMESAPQPL